MRITRLYVDGFKCFSDFEFKPHEIQPIFGRNGSGKSAVFEVLVSLKKLIVEGQDVKDCIPHSTFSKLFKASCVRIELDSTDGRNSFRYELTILLHPTIDKVAIGKEELHYNSTRILHSTTNNVQILYANTKIETTKRNIFRSSLSTLIPGLDSDAAINFSKWIGNLQVISIHPSAMSTSKVMNDDRTLELGGSNFVSWFRHLALTRLHAISALNDHLRDAVEGFDSMSFVSRGDSYILQVTFIFGSLTKYRSIYDYHELSDGQRLLIVLYSVYHALRGSNAVLCLDEPANYLSLTEIQPFLNLLRDSVGDSIAQLFIVTHNAEAIDDLAPDKPVVFYRDEAGFIRVSPFPEVNPLGLSASKLLSLGWEKP